VETTSDDVDDGMRWRWRMGMRDTFFCEGVEDRVEVESDD